MDIADGRARRSLRTAEGGEHERIAAGGSLDPAARAIPVRDEMLETIRASLKRYAKEA